MSKRALLLAGLVLLPGLAFAQSTATDVDCTTLAQQAAAGLSATIQADNQTITPPKSVTTLTCLSSFFNGTGLNVVTNLLNPAALLQAVEGQLCAAVQNAWKSTIGSLQCGITLTGFQMGGFGLGGGNLCPKLTFGGGGAPIGSVGVGVGSGSNGLNVPGTGMAPKGYTLPQTINGLY